MSHFLVAFEVEFYKLRRSMVPWLTLLFLLFIVSQEAGQPDWSGFLDGAIYRFTILGAIGFGFLTSWLFGREYTDRTFKDLLSLPVSRWNLVLAKYVAVFVSCLAMTVILFLYVFSLGSLVGLPGFSWDILLQALGVFTLTACFNLLLCSLVALLASWSRGWLAPIGFVFLTLVLALSLGGSAAGPYVPWAMPTLQTLEFTFSRAHMDTLNILSYIILGITGLGGLIGTLAWWRFADQR